MSALGNIIKKEMKELLTPATFLPIIVVAIIFGSMGNTISEIGEEATSPPIIGLINEENTTYSYIASSIFHENAQIVYESSNISDKDQAIEEIKKENGVALIIIPENLTELIDNNKPGSFEIYWIMKGAGILDTFSSSSVESLLGLINTEISSNIIEQNNNTVNATIVLNPTDRIETTNFKEIDFKGISPTVIISIMSTQSIMIPLIMMMIIIMAGQMVISSMALEKENKTLETLLTLPVKRVSIVTGKIAASAAVGLLLAFIYMIGMGNYMQSFNMGGTIQSSGFDMSLSSFDILLVGLSLLITLIAALSLCMLLGTLAKNFKSAQTLTFPIVMMALFPMLITMFTDFDTLPLGLKALVFAIPFSHPMMAPRALLFSDYMLVIGGMIYVAIFAVIMISLVVWIFRTDRLLTGSTRTKNLFKFKMRR